MGGSEVAMVRGVLLAVLFSLSSGGDLAVEVRLGAAVVPFGGEVRFTTRFVNRGAAALCYYEPAHATMDCFPEVRFVRIEDGREFLPWNPPYQTMVSEGLVGAVRTLDAGGEISLEYARGRFLPVRESEAGQPARLPPGEYRVVASYGKEDDLVPFNTGGFEETLRPWKGPLPLFTGRIESEPVRLTVEAPSEPWIELRQPDAGRPELVVSFMNPTAAAAAIPGEAILEAHSKMYGGGEAGVAFGTALSIPAVGHREERIDLRRLTFRTRHGPRGIHEMIPEGTTWFRLSFRGAGGAETAGTDGIFGTVPPPEDAGLGGLRVTVSAEGAALTVTVRNDGEGPVRIVRRLAYPHEVLLRIARAGGDDRVGNSVTRTAPESPDGLRPVGGEGSMGVARGLSFDGDRFEEVNGLTESDFRVLAPGESLARTLDVGGLIHGGLPPGEYSVRAAYRCVESGSRLGLAEPAPTGVRWSAPVRIAVAGK
jgi:hypothetical protein